jgi:CTP:molybdopterin cytidylyltransferase MocA
MDLRNPNRRLSNEVLFPPTEKSESCIEFCYLRHMNRAPSFCGVILSAGASTRMGRDKALLPWPPLQSGATPPGHTFLSSAIASLSLHSDMVLVVVGQNESNVAPVIYSNGAFLVRNPDPSRGQFSSLQVGLQEVLNRGRDAAIVTLVDRPPVNPATMAKLRTAFEAAYSRGQWATVPEHRGKHGHPFVIGREMIEAFLTAPVTATAREVEHNHQQHIEYFPVDDPFTTMNVDTLEDYADLTGTPVV